MRDAVSHIIRESRQHAHRERTGFLPSSAPGGRGGRVDIVVSDAAAGHTLVDIIVADPTLRDLVERAAVRSSATYFYIIKDNSLVGQSCHSRLPNNWRVLLC